MVRKAAPKDAMRHRRLASWRPAGRRGAAVRAAAALPITVGVALSAFAQPRPGSQNLDWPCRQILVAQLSLPAVWSGPPIEGVTWRDDRTVAGLVTRLAARRTPLDEADQAIEEFAKTLGADKAKKLIALFAGLFDTLDGERTRVIESLLRFGAKQRELAAKIRAESASSNEEAAKPPRKAQKDALDGRARELEWDLRIFEERRHSIAFVCDAPASIEQRLFALARAIQHRLD